MRWFNKKPIHVELPGLQRTVDEAVALAQSAARTVLGDQRLIIALVNEKIALCEVVEQSRRDIQALQEERELLHAALAQRDIQIDSLARTRDSLTAEVKRKRSHKKKVVAAFVALFLAFPAVYSLADESDDCAIEDDGDVAPAPSPFLYTEAGTEC